MLASLLTALGFSFSVIFAARSARILGGATANLVRLSLAMVLLAIWAHTFGSGFQGGAFLWFFLSGVIGFGLGDMALFGALERIGPRLSILLTQCLAAPFSALAEWLWLGTTIPLSELLWAGAILVGVGFALAPDHGWEGDRRTFWIGAVFGTCSAAGQALGAVVTRKANVVAKLGGWEIDGGTAAYQRILGGVLMTGLAYLIFKKMRPAAGELTPSKWRQAWPLVAANALAGPTLGVACYQWALRVREAAIVLPLVATSPLITMLLTWLIDGTRPSRRVAVGGIIAVCAVAGLKYFSARG